MLSLEKLSQYKSQSKKDYYSQLEIKNLVSIPRFFKERNKK